MPCVVLLSEDQTVREWLQAELFHCGCRLWEAGMPPSGRPELVLLDVSAGADWGRCWRDLREAGLGAPVLLFDGADRSAEADAALLRKIRLLAAPEEAEFRFGGVCVNFSDGRVTRSGAEVSLSAKQRQLLHYLIHCRGTLLSRAEILQEVWHYRATETRTLDVHIAALRRKLEEDPSRPRFIRTQRRKGYLFQE